MEDSISLIRTETNVAVILFSFMIQIFTIGFTGKSAETFFKMLQTAGVKKLVDTRLNNSSQLAGFAKGADLHYFANTIAGIDYEHDLDLAPTKDLLSGYRNKELSWKEYEKEYLDLMGGRRIGEKYELDTLHKACFLCSEHSPQYCHRRLLAEYLKATRNDVEIIHLIG